MTPFLSSAKECSFFIHSYLHQVINITSSKHLKLHIHYPTAQMAVSDGSRSKTDLRIAPLVAGITAGSASTILLYPLDLIKVRFQVQVNEQFSKSSSSSIHNAIKTQIQPRRQTMMNTMRGILRYEGISGLYQGLSPALLGSAASWGGYFFLYEWMKSRVVEYKKMENETYKLSHLENFTAACASGAIMVAFTNPIWLIKTRMQLQMKNAQAQLKSGSTISNETLKPPYKSMTDAARTIIREESVFALYKGSAAALMLTSNGGVQFVCYEYLKSQFGEYTKFSRSKSNASDEKAVIFRLQDSIGYLSMGAISKIIASTSTYPIQVIKSRLQQRSQTAEINLSGDVQIVKRHYTGVVDCIRQIFRKEGVYGFFKGAIPNALRVAPSAAITFVVYESVMDMLS